MPRPGQDRPRREKSPKCAQAATRRLKLEFSFGGASRLGACASRIGFGMHEHPAIPHTHIECRNFLDERRRRRAGVRMILVAVPRTSDAAENNFALAERAVLMLADVRDGGNLSVVFENRHAFAGEADDAGAVFGNIRYSAGVNELVVRSSRCNDALTIRSFRM